MRLAKLQNSIVVEIIEAAAPFNGYFAVPDEVMTGWKQLGTAPDFTYVAPKVYGSIEDGVVVNTTKSHSTLTGYVELPSGVAKGWEEDGSGGYTPPVVVVPPLTEADYSGIVQEHLDSRARVYNYDNANSAISYADEPAVSKFQDEGKAIRAWRSNVWAAAITILEDVNSGARTAPTPQELIDELPDFPGVTYT